MERKQPGKKPQAANVAFARLQVVATHRHRQAGTKDAKNSTKNREKQHKTPGIVRTGKGGINITLGKKPIQAQPTHRKTS